MKGKQLIRKLRRLGVTIIENRGKGGHVLAKFQAKQATIPVHGDVDLGNIFIKKYANNWALTQMK
jgi:mRNA interferase HicA